MFEHWLSISVANYGNSAKNRLKLVIITESKLCWAIEQQLKKQSIIP